MLIITEALKGWLVENCDAKADATEDESRKTTGDAIASGKLSLEKYAELTKDPDGEKAEDFNKSFAKMADGMEKLTELLTAKEEVKEGSEGEKKEVKEEKKETKEVNSNDIGEKVVSMGGTPDDPNGGGGPDVRVKAAIEAYNDTKTALMYPTKTRRDTKHPFAGQQVTRDSGEGMDVQTDRDKALSGVWSKFQVMAVTPLKAGTPLRAYEMMNEHEKGLFHHLVEETEWYIGQEDVLGSRVKGYPGGVKALIDDATSGGLEAAPSVFDDDVIQTPLQFGELFPGVKKVNLTRGRRIEGVSTGTVTSSWGGVDDTAVTLFNTAAYVAAFDTTIYRWEGAIRIGLDFLSDTPIDFQRHVTTQYGERLLEDLDDVIATGNGTTQPQGITNSGATVVAFGAATSLANYESLLFSVHSREKKPNLLSSIVFCGTYTSYQRARGIAVGGTDVRRIFGVENYDERTIMSTPYKINESLTNQQIFYAILARYRMYVRKGFTVRTSTEGDTLIRRNEMLIVVMGRYGGQVERGAVAGLTTTAPA